MDNITLVLSYFSSRPHIIKKPKYPERHLTHPVHYLVQLAHSLNSSLGFLKFNSRASTISGVETSFSPQNYDHIINSQ
jgi:hypothetical protein